MRFKIGTGEISGDVRGEGPAVLFLHAFPLNLTMWDGQAAALAKTHQVLRFDARGFGGSAPGDGLLTMERIADDAVAFLDEAGVSQATVCGLSMGGYAALALMRRHPERVKALILADTRADADRDEARQGRATLAAKVRQEGASAAAAAFVPRLLGTTTHAERPEVVARVREMILGTAPAGIVNALAGLAARADSTPSLKEIRVPTLVVCGVEDVITPPALAKVLEAGIAGARLALVPRAGHLSNLENPAAFNAAVAAFLATIG